MGGSSGPVGSSTSYELPEWLTRDLRGASDRLLDQTVDLGRQGQELAGQVKSDFSGFNPALNTEFGAPKLSEGLNGYGNSLLSKGLETVKNQAAARRASVGQAVKNPLLANILQSQDDAKTALNLNGLPFMAAEAGRSREVQDYQMGQGAQAATNAARLASASQGANTQILGNQALNQRFNFGQSSINASQGLMGILGALGALSGRQNVSPYGGEAPAPAAAGSSPRAPSGSAPTGFVPQKGPNGNWFNPSTGEYRW